MKFLKIQWYSMACLFLIAGLSISSCGTDSNDDDDEPALEEFSGDFIPSNAEVTTSATGSTAATINQDTREVSFDVTWAGLSSAVVGMHFHDAGPVIHGIEGWDAETSGNVTGSVTFSAEEAADLAAGDVYVQIHTEDYPGGEVVAPLTKTSNNNNNDDPPDNGDGY